MRLVVQGSKTFNDYPLFCRAIGVAFSDLKSGDILDISSLGPAALTDHVMEFTNKTRQTLKQKKIVIVFKSIAALNIDDPGEFDLFYYFCDNGRGLSRTAQWFKDSGIEVLEFNN